MRRWRLLVAALGLAVWLTGCAVVETAGDVAIGTIRACEAGVMDIPWSPNNYMKSRVMPARDADGEGNIPARRTAEPGQYELRYVTGLQHQVLARSPIEITP